MAQNPHMVFVVRASVRDGLGHLVRSLSVLREVMRRTSAHLVLVGDTSGSHLANESGIPWTQCTTDDEAADECWRQQPRIVVFDTLRFEDHPFDRVAAGVVTVSLSPVFAQMHRVDHLFHRTVHEDPFWAKDRGFPAIHKGLQFAVLPSWLKRVTTRHYREHLHEDKLAVAISMGGTDAPNRTLALLKLLGQCPAKLVLFVALGDAYTHSYEDLLATAAHNRQEIILLKSNESMWRVLKNVSLVICAGGLTTYEAAFIGLPAINILQRPEWAYLFEELVEKGASHTLPPQSGCLDRVVQMVGELADDRAHLMQMHLATKGLIPDGGSRRIAAKLATLKPRLSQA